MRRDGEHELAFAVALSETKKMPYLCRLLLALLCLTLPYAAAASVSSSMGCHNTAQPMTDTKQPTAKHMQRGMAQYATFHRHAQSAAQHMHGDCDCVKKCGCVQHCAGSCAITPSLATTLAPWPPAYAIAAPPVNVPDLPIAPLFRPPITALS